MVLTVVRAIFITVVVYIALSYAEEVYQEWKPVSVLGVALVCCLAVIAIDMSVRRKSLLGLSGAFFGLVVGLVCTYAICLALDLVTATFYRRLTTAQLSTIKLFVGAVACYACVSVVLQSKDDVRVVIPYVEFSKQVKGSQPVLLDTSAIIDGRIADVVETRMFDAPLTVPRFVLQELQAIADSADRQKRNRGRRGLDILSRLQRCDAVEVHIYDGDVPAAAANEGVDQKLVALATQMGGRVMTTDYNLNKIAQLHGVTVLNINDLANALKPAVIAGEKMTVKIIKPGEEAGQGVGYLEDGTMVVVEGAREQIGQTIDFFVSSVLQTSAGKMIFGRMEGAPEPDRRRRGGRSG